MVVLFHSVGLSPCSNPQEYFAFHSYCRCIVGSSETGLSKRRQVLEQVDLVLSSGDERSALSLVKDLQGKPDGLRCFGAARQNPREWSAFITELEELQNFREQLPDFEVVYEPREKNKKADFLAGNDGPSSHTLDHLYLYGWMKTTTRSPFYDFHVLVPQRLYTLDELKLNGINAALLLSPKDTTLGSIERNLQIASLSGGIAAWKAFDLSSQQLFFISLGLLFLWTLDLVSFNGGIGSLILDTIGHTFSQRYHNRVVQHEAGHFLVAYLIGILPRGYTLSSLEAFQKEGSLNIQAGTAFVDYEFVEEVNSGKVSATMLNIFSCIALAGVATEYLLYGYAEGGLEDISKLDGLVKSLGFTQKKADSQVRWSVLNTILLLRRHEVARSKLAEAMSNGESIGSCIQIIEDSIDTSDI